MRKMYKFTLTEMLAVIAIITIVISAGIVGYNMAMKSARDAATKSTIMKLEIALNELYKKYGTYPLTADDKFFTIDLTTEGEEKINELSAKDLKGYVSKFIDLVDYEDLDKDEDGCLLDGYGNKLIYFCPGKINKKSFDIISAGEDEVFNFDVENWNYAYTDFDDDNANDDIANFNLDK